MFVTRENKNTSKKKFQKPNILRKKPKGVPAKPSSQDTKESHDVISPANTRAAETPELHLEKFKSNKASGKPARELDPDNHFVFIEESNACESTKVDLTSNLVTNGNSLLINTNEEENASQSPINIEFLLNDGDLTQNNTQFDIDGETDCHIKHDWCFDFSSGSQEIIIENFARSDLENEFLSEEPASSRVSAMTVNEDSSPAAVLANQSPVENLTVEYFASSTMNFKCDAPDCNKRFRSEQKLTKHKLTHNADSAKAAKLTTLECPVRREGAGGAQERCGRTFLVRENLVKHLNEDHSPEDATFVCGECGRRFFWASGVRAHARAHCGRPPALACAWPGCGRVFRQPCRLREHARAHTGDKPYPCRYPNCGWSFRTASKLLRHARRHTGERRHACQACGRAFLRREHLRDHCARHHAHKHSCAHAGCHRTFTNIDALFTHMKKVHREEPAAATVGEVALGEGGGEGAAGAEERAARTHCTWPLPPRAAPARDQPGGDQCVLEEDVHVELSEGLESNMYTIRSDLFLHGNVLTNEDSEPIPGVSVADAADAGGGAPHAVDADLGLLDAHPTIDLMQEELMYTDAAVDETSFRVFLLSGEELQIV